MRSGSHVQLAALRNRDLELQTTFGLLSLKRQVIMVQILSIHFFFVGFLQFLLGFSKVPVFFLCLPVQTAFIYSSAAL